LPLAKETYKPIEWKRDQAIDIADKMAIVVTNKKGDFRFDNVPDGKYRLLAQKWIGPYQGVFKVHGTVIQLMGTAEDIVVPRPSDYQQALVVLQPPGRGIVQFDQDVGNSGTFMFLSTSPLEFDPILGLQAMGTPFLQRLIGVNRMPDGKTTVIGVPDKPLYAFFIAPDNSPGYAAIEVTASQSGLVRVLPEPFIAGWSDGRKDPPAKLAEIEELMAAKGLTVKQLLKIPDLSSANHKAYRERMQELAKNLSRIVELPEGRTARVGDLLALDSYRQLKQEKR
jgi:hypothetical protein